MGIRGGGSGGLVSEVADEAATALSDIDRFEAKRKQEEQRRKKGGSRHENWFSKPHVATSRTPNPRGAIKGALVEEPNWYTFVAEESGAKSKEEGEQGGEKLRRRQRRRD